MLFWTCSTLSVLTSGSWLTADIISAISLLLLEISTRSFGFVFLAAAVLSVDSTFAGFVTLDVGWVVRFSPWPSGGTLELIFIWYSPLPGKICGFLIGNCLKTFNLT